MRAMLEQAAASKGAKRAAARKAARQQDREPVPWKGCMGSGTGTASCRREGFGVTGCKMRAMDKTWWMSAKIREDVDERRR